MSHTPGPWVWGKNNDGLFSGEARYNEYGNSEDNAVLAYAPYEGMWIREDSDAALIAAAPELLEACKTVLQRGYLYTGDLDFVRAAIAKAEGK